MFNASLFAASILPISTAYAVGEGLGLETGLDKKLLTNDRELMGDHVNSCGFNIVAWTTVGAMIALTVALAVTQMRG